MRSHFGLLSNLTSSPAIAPSLYTSLFSHLKSCPGTYYILVIVDRSNDQLVAAGTLIVERKHIHGAGMAGHIEDIVVAPETRGKGLGKQLVDGLREMGTGLGCYKTILDCQNEKIREWVHYRGRS
jgi:ribosomal protein S18 acetylase RimI-like enzyme